MNTKVILKRSFINALGTVIYVMIVALIMTSAEKAPDETKSFIIPIAMLLLFLTSATITSSLVLGKPIMLYIDNQKQDAVKLFLYTVSWLIAFTLIALISAKILIWNV